MQDVKHPTVVIFTPEHGSDKLLSPKFNHSHVLFTPQTLLMGNTCENVIHSSVIALYGCSGGGEVSPYHSTSDVHHYHAHKHQYTTIHTN